MVQATQWLLAWPAMITASYWCSWSTSAVLRWAMRLAVGASRHLGADDRVVLGQRVAALDLEVGLG